MTKIARIQLPEPHPAQEIFTDWETKNPEARVLVAPAGTKVGKSFGCSLWEITAQLVNPGLYGVWIAPTLYKCRVGYRYMKAMLPDIPGIKCRDSSLEINLANHSFIKFMHGRDAEVTVEGDAIDTFVIDESGKQREQLWHSLFTTITQTDGRGIITGTPRGRNWYYHLYTKALAGDPMLCHAKLRTIDSPYVKQAAVDRAKRILPPLLYSQYYLADFVSDSSVYGALDGVWRDELPVLRPGFWLHPDAELRRQTVVMGVDLAKRHDYTVITAITGKGETVGFLRMRRKTYQEQAQILAKFASYFGGDDNEIRYDRTGVGDAVGEEISRIFDKHPGDWTISPVIFTNASKQEMVSRVTWAIETGFWRCPRIPRLEHEMINLEVSTSKSGLATYSAPPGDHDDCHWSLALALSGVHSSNAMGRSVDMIEAAMSGQLLTESEDEDDLEDDDTDLDDTLDDLDDDFLDDIREMM